MSPFFISVLLFVTSAHAALPGSPPTLETIEQVEKEYHSTIEPLLTEHCADCHSRKEPHSVFLALPVVNWFTRPYIQENIRKARLAYDLSVPVPFSKRVRASEFLLRLRLVMKANSMPPTLYRVAHLGKNLSEAERTAIDNWAAAGVKAMSPLGRSSYPPHKDSTWLTTLAQEVIAACPMAPKNDSAAHTRCAEKLKEMELLQTGMGEPFLWGQQTKPQSYELKQGITTLMNPLVWRKMYLSLYMFEPGYRIEELEDRTVVHLPCHFRNLLEEGSYPYPFWHSKQKWEAYQTNTEVLLVVKKGFIAGALRSAEKDPKRPIIERNWSKQWVWQDPISHAQEPRAAFFASLFSTTNPFVGKLDAAYRELALGFQDQNCLECHSPNNSSQMRLLELLSYPNQSLASRDRVVNMLEGNAMPPVDGVKSTDDQKRLLSSAKKFRDLATQALAFEGESVGHVPR